MRHYNAAIEPICPDCGFLQSIVMLSCLNPLHPDPTPMPTQPEKTPQNVTQTARRPVPDPVARDYARADAAAKVVTLARTWRTIGHFSPAIREFRLEELAAAVDAYEKLVAGDA